MSQTVKKEDSEGQVAPATPIEEENLIHLSAEAQLRLAELILNPRPPSPEIERLKAIRDKLIRKSCE